MDEKLLNRIVADPQVCGGKPCIRGTRIPVAVILASLAEGMTAGEIIEHYPHLSPEDIRAALAYAADLSQEGVWKV